MTDQTVKGDIVINFPSHTQCYHALALLYYYSNQASQALSIWTKWVGSFLATPNDHTHCFRISDGELTDKDFPGFGFIVDFLSKYMLLLIALLEHFIKNVNTTTLQSNCMQWNLC